VRAGAKGELIVTLKTHTPTAVWTHCVLHQRALVVKKMPTNLQNLLSEALKIINFIESRPLQSKLSSHTV
jgi:hypothetical protein